jgi:hypothetical protein
LKSEFCFTKVNDLLIWTAGTFPASPNALRPITDILYSQPARQHTYILPDSDAKAEAILHPVAPVDPREPALNLKPRAVLVDELMRLDRTFTDRKILIHLPRPKLARMLICAMDAQPAVERRG